MHRSTLHFRPRLRFIEGEEGGAATTATTVVEPVANGDQAKTEPLGEGGIKALQAEREAKATAVAELAALRKEIEDGKKSAEQKASDDLLAAQKAATESATKALKYEVAASKSLPLSLALRLSGSTKEELESDADDLKALLPDAKSSSPRPDRSQGGGSSSGASSVGRGRDLYAERHKPKK